MLSLRPTKLCSERRRCIAEIQERPTDFLSLERILCPVQAYVNPHVMSDRRSFTVSGSNATREPFLNLQWSLKWLLKVGHTVIDLDPNLIGKGFVRTQDLLRQVRSPNCDDLLRKYGWQVISAEPRGCFPQRQGLHILYSPSKRCLSL